jgi:DNA helicase-2/ATP-dependent DNA helicase PcrA
MDDELRAHLLRFREAVRRWLGASILPIDQLVLTLAQELFTAPADLALGYKLALVLRAHATQHPDKRLTELVEELALIARNQRRFLGFDEADLGYEPKKGTITVSTMHKAKGLEWDRVYLLGVNNYNYPSAEAHDYFRGESWFVSGQLNLEAEAIAQLELLQEKELADYVPGEASEKARIDFAAERLRLLYVGITRAKKELIITWNTGRAPTAEKVRAAPFVALQKYWEERES